MSYESLITDPAIVSYHKLQETKGTIAADETPHERHGTFTNMGADPVTEAGPTAWLPSAVRFDGSNDYMSFSGTVAPLTNWTIACWVKTAQTGSRWLFAEGMFGATLPVMGIVNNAGFFQVFCRVSSSSVGQVQPVTSHAINDNEWHFLQFGRSGTEFTAYANGELVLAVSNPMGYPTTDRSAAGALLRSTAGSYANAAIAGAIKFSRELTLEEHQALYAGPTDEPSTISHKRRRMAARRKYR